MCTVTWWKRSTEFDFFFNRDESRSRLPGVEPVVSSVQGVRLVAPKDGAAGGTWIFGNEYGLVAGILNRYDVDDAVASRSGTRISRGLLLLSLAASKSVEALDQRLRGMDLSPYRHFLIVGLDLHCPARQWNWNGRFLEVTGDVEKRLPVTTSSFDPEEVMQTRKELFATVMGAAQRPSVDLFRRFHETEIEGRPEYSVCMEREDAITVSFSHLTVTRDEVRFRYAPRSEGSQRFAPITEVVLRRSRG